MTEWCIGRCDETIRKGTSEQRILRHGSLCGHQVAVDATKSQQREDAAERAEGGLLCLPSKNDTRMMLG